MSNIRWMIPNSFCCIVNIAELANCTNLGASCVAMTKTGQVDRGILFPKTVVLIHKKIKLITDICVYHFVTIC